MKINATSVDDYISKLPVERQEAFTKLRNSIKQNIPEGFKETLSYGMIGYVVPKSIYKPGYHANKELPLPFINIGNQKHYIALYHSGIYASKELYNWFVDAYARHCNYKLDMGKSCIRFKYLDDIPFQLIEELVRKITVEEWIDLYEKSIKK